MLRFYRDNWYNIAGAICFFMAFLMGFWSDRFSPLQVILIYSFMALLAHQFEEYVLPGGAPVVLNAVFFGEKKDYDRYPGNKQSCMLVNTLAWLFYITPIFFPEYIWWGLATMFFGFFQVLGHGILMNVKGKTWYNAGMATAVFLHLPIGIYYIQYVTAHGLASHHDYIFAALTLMAATVLIVALPVQGLRSRNTHFPFSDKELTRFNMVEKYRAKGVISFVRQKA